MTLKSRLRATQCHWKRIREPLFDIEYYRDLEIWVRRHSRSLTTVPFDSLCTVSYSPSIVTMAIGLSLAISETFSVKK